MPSAVSEATAPVTPEAALAAMAATTPQVAAAPAAPTPAAEAEPAAKVRPATWKPVTAPMVGTFYAAPAPGKPPFVQVGDEVAAGETLCIVEAMKLMNEIKSEQEARVRRILVENEQAVEYGQVLFELEPLNGRPLDAL